MKTWVLGTYTWVYNEIEGKGTDGVEGWSLGGREIGCRVRGGASGVQRNEGGAVAVRRGSPKVSQHLGE